MECWNNGIVEQWPINLVRRWFDEKLTNQSSPTAARGENGTMECWNDGMVE
ncbi:MAG: hypothetical protein AB9834_17170 [Lentimicrobium sp.]